MWVCLFVSGRIVAEECLDRMILFLGSLWLLFSAPGGDQGRTVIATRDGTVETSTPPRYLLNQAHIKEYKIERKVPHKSPSYKKSIRVSAPPVCLNRQEKIKRRRILSIWNKENIEIIKSWNFIKITHSYL